MPVSLVRGDPNGYLFKNERFHIAPVLSDGRWLPRARFPFIFLPPPLIHISFFFK